MIESKLLQATAAGGVSRLLVNHSAFGREHCSFADDSTHDQGCMRAFGVVTGVHLLWQSVLFPTAAGLITMWGISRERQYIKLKAFIASFVAKQCQKQSRF